MTTDQVLSHFERVKRCSSGWSTRCPAHDDTKNSLSISECDGKIMIHCFAGCEIGSIVAHAGLAMTDLFLGSSSNGASPRLVATYSYRDENGKLTSQVLRDEHKG